MTVRPEIPDRPSFNWLACSTVRATTRDRPMLDWNSKRVLGRPHVLEGVVAAGRQTVRTLGTRERRDELGERLPVAAPEDAGTAGTEQPLVRAGRQEIAAEVRQVDVDGPRTRARRRRTGLCRRAARRAISWIGTRTPVLECTQVSATTFVFFVTASRRAWSCRRPWLSPGLRTVSIRWTFAPVRLFISCRDLPGGEEVVAGGEHLVALLQRQAAVHHRQAHRGAAGQRVLRRGRRRRIPRPPRGPLRSLLYPTRRASSVSRAELRRDDRRSRHPAAGCAGRGRTPRTERAWGRAGTAPGWSPSRAGPRRGGRSRSRSEPPTRRRGCRRYSPRPGRPHRRCRLREGSVE